MRDYLEFQQGAAIQQVLPAWWNDLNLPPVGPLRASSPMEWVPQLPDDRFWLGNNTKALGGSSIIAR